MSIAFIRGFRTSDTSWPTVARFGREFGAQRCRLDLLRFLGDCRKPASPARSPLRLQSRDNSSGHESNSRAFPAEPKPVFVSLRSEEHTSELQSHSDLVCRLLLEKKKRPKPPYARRSQPTGSQPEHT